jgi:hypothetical protein
MRCALLVLRSPGRRDVGGCSQLYAPLSGLTIHTISATIAIQLFKNWRYHEDDFEHT